MRMPCEGSLIAEPTLDETTAQRAETLFQEQQKRVHRCADRTFTWLMFAQWLAGIGLAFWLSPRMGGGADGRMYASVWMALWMGAGFTLYPLLLIWRRPGSTLTRHSVALGQLLMSGLLIHITGGRLETHFHVFGSLAFLVFYRDWRVLVTATLVTTLDHYLRGVYWPHSLYGTNLPENWRWLEHAGWVLFEDVFLILSGVLSLREMRAIAHRQAQLDTAHVILRKTTEELKSSEFRFRSLSDFSPIGVLQTDASGLLTYANERCLAILGMEEATCLGEGWTETIHPTYREEVVKAWQTAVLGGFRFFSEHRLIDEVDGRKKPRWVQIRTTVVQSPEGAITGYVGTVEDITSPRLAMEALNEAHEILEARVTERTAELEAEITERERAEAGLREIAVEQKQAQEQIRQQFERLTALRAIEKVISSSLEVEVTLNILLDQVISQLAVDAAAVLLLNPDTQTLEYAGGCGFWSTNITHTSLRMGEGAAGSAAQSGSLVSILDLHAAGSGYMQATRIADEEFIEYYGVPLIAKGQVQGVLEVYNRSTLYIDGEWLEFLETLAGQAAIAVENATLFDALQRSNRELTQAYDATIEGWSRALDLRDRETEGHTQRVTEMTVRLAATMGFCDADLVQVRRGALLHDIGKMGIPDQILLKPGPLTDEEREIMKQHTTFALEMLSPIAFLHAALDIPYCHHERWDGTGYPRQLQGEQIPLTARLFAVVDVWDALRFDRPYRKGWPEEKVLEYLRSESGTHFDPRCVEIFLQILESQEREETSSEAKAA